MEDSDFDPRVLELAEEFAYAIYGGVAHGLRVDNPLAYAKDKAEWIKAHLLLFIKEYARISE